jgi:plastocyanin domain-containing protein
MLRSYPSLLGSLLSLLVLTGLPTIAARTHAEAAAEAAPREIEIVVEGAYKPSRIEIREGERVRLKFVRKDYGSCTREVVFPKLDIRRELPTNKPVSIDLPLLAPGEYAFHCGMKMVKGTLVVLPKA